MKNEGVFEGFVFENPTVNLTPTNRKVYTLVLEQEDIYPSGDSKMLQVPFETMGDKLGERVMSLKVGDKVTVVSKQVAFKGKAENAKLWPKNSIKNFTVEKKAESPSRTLPPVAQNSFDDIPF